jgi:hypothetical protein
LRLSVELFPQLALDLEGGEESRDSGLYLHIINFISSMHEPYKEKEAECEEERKISPPSLDADGRCNLKAGGSETPAQAFYFHMKWNTIETDEFYIASNLSTRSHRSTSPLAPSFLPKNFC